MISGIQTSDEFKRHTRSTSRFGRRKGLLVEIDKRIDKAHVLPAEEVLMCLHDIEAVCNAWIDVHPLTTVLQEKGKKLSNRRKGIEALIEQIKKKRQALYKISDSDLKKKKDVTDLYERSSKELSVTSDNNVMVNSNRTLA